MVKIINNSVCRGVAGARATAKPKGVVIHNTADNATAEQHMNRLAGMSTSALAAGFAHYFIDENTIIRTEDTFNMAWHTANADGNANYVGYEVCRSTGTQAAFLAAEQNTFKQVAEDLKYWGLKATRDTVRLHKEFSATACPHRSWDLHGQSVNAVKDYFIQQINKYMNGTTTTSSVSKPVAVDPAAAGAGNPVKSDGNRSKAHLDRFGIKNGKLWANGWHIGNYNYEFIFVMDKKTGKELMRVKAPSVTRSDVAKVYGTSAGTGFDVSFDLAKLKGKTVYVMARCTNDSGGDTKGGCSDIRFSEWFLDLK